MKLMRKRNKGITLISVILAVIVILIIIGTITYSSRSSFQMKKLENLYSDIDSLNDSMSIYYVKNSQLPVYYSSYNVDGSKADAYQVFTIKNEEITEGTYYLNFKEENREPGKTYSDFVNYAIIDMSKIGGYGSALNLNNVNNVPEGIENGEFGKLSTDKDALYQAIEDGIFVVNLYTHKVYYTKGISVQGSNYYTKDDNGKDVPNFKKVEEPSIEDSVLSEAEKPKFEGITVRFLANGGSGAPSELHIEMDEASSHKNLLYHINKSVGGYPSKTGMLFTGWDRTSSAQNPEYKYDKPTGLYTKTRNRYRSFYLCKRISYRFVCYLENKYS